MRTSTYLLLSLCISAFGVLVPQKLVAQSKPPVEKKRDEAPNMQQLFEIAKRYEIPMPPKDAKLILAHTGWRTPLGNSSTSRDPGIYSPAFLLEKRKDGSAKVLRGRETETLEGRRGGTIRDFDLEKVERKLGGFFPSFNRSSSFICAVQLAERGELELAKALWKKGRAERGVEDFHHHENQGEYLDDPPKLLARSIYEYLWKETLREPKRWPQIQALTKKLFEEFPFLIKSDGGSQSIFADQRKEFLDDLTATVKAPPPKPNSVEALLLEWSRDKSTHRDLFGQNEVGTTIDGPAEKILTQGKSAVPELLELLDDKRITAEKTPQINNSIPRIRRVGDLADRLLDALSGQVRSRFFDLTPRKPGQEWKDWWAKNRDLSEKDMLLKYVFTRSNGRIKSVNRVPAVLLALRYPEELPSLAKAFVSESVSSLQAFTLAEAFARARIPKEERVRLLLMLLVENNIERRRNVLQVLATLDAAKCAELLDLVIDQLPHRPTGALWTCPEASYTHVVMRLEDDRIWKKYLDYTRKCEVGLRLEIMNPMDYSYIKGKNRDRRLAFLAAFLNDDTLRPKLDQSGPFAAFKFPTITVRDFVAMEIAAILEFDDSPDEFWTAEQWKGLREKVKVALKSEKLPDWSK